MMKTQKIYSTSFKLKGFGYGDGLKLPTDPSFRNTYTFEMKVKHCNITDVKILYAIIKKQLQIEEDVIKRLERNKDSVHPLQYNVKEFLQNILTQMENSSDNDLSDINYYILKSR